jgi:hypothetical protein
MVQFLNYLTIKINTMKTFNLIIILAFLIVSFSCDNSDFSPFEPQSDQISLSCILDNRLSPQFAVAQQLYNIERNGKIPGKAKITISEISGKIYQFKDTVIDGLSNCSVYYAPDLRLKRDSYYKIGLFMDSVSLEWSEIYVPPVALLGFQQHVDTIKGDFFDRMVYYTMLFYSKTASDIHSIIIYVDYWIYELGQSKSYTLKVPINIKVLEPDKLNPEKTVYEYEDNNLAVTYSSIYTDKKSENRTHPYAYSGIFLPNDNFLYAIKKLDYKGDPKNIIIRKAYAVYYSIDRFLYNSYMKKGREIYSVRLDRPFQIANTFRADGPGLGVVGAMTADTLRFFLPDEVIAKFGLTNAQW